MPPNRAKTFWTEFGADPSKSIMRCALEIENDDRVHHVHVVLRWLAVATARGASRREPTRSIRPEPTAGISGGLGPVGVGAIQSWISNGTTAMFEAIPYASRSTALMRPSWFESGTTAGASL